RLVWLCGVEFARVRGLLLLRRKRFWRVGDDRRLHFCTGCLPVCVCIGGHEHIRWQEVN
uniref:Uncharacterized protein n=1 Tax=Anopheles albimanus TaxID=7167 RepID=A0A182FWQ3_ANOAL